MFSSKCLIMLLCLPAFAKSANPVPHIGSRPLSTGLFEIVSSVSNQRLNLAGAIPTDDNPIIGFADFPGAKNQEVRTRDRARHRNGPCIIS
ncbi:hypothetical protein BD410DRAFT_85707 [Rickenella mellea]|uniref:Uncharacterized protein n=1 Tax=Rickenella mellea TaxID=50990 RepID=A0A4Y7PJX3_9AGAM|nr:hypothetical protein BD410DRAFT_85707 [Rickenella mellea]